MSITQYAGHLIPDDFKNPRSCSEGNDRVKSGALIVKEGYKIKCSFYNS
jgi:hypothetical protein